MAATPSGLKENEYKYGGGEEEEEDKRNKTIRLRAPDRNITPPPTNHLVPKMTIKTKNPIKDKANINESMNE